MTITCVIIVTISQIQLPGTIYTSTDASIETLPLYCSIKASTHVKNSTIINWKVWDQQVVKKTWSMLYTFSKTCSYFSCYCLVHVVICLALVSD